MYCCDARDCTGGADGKVFESTDLSEVTEHEKVCANCIFHHTDTSTQGLVCQQACPQWAEFHDTDGTANPSSGGSESADGTTEPAAKKQKTTTGNVEQ